MDSFRFETNFVDKLARVEKKRYTQEIKIIKTLYVDGPQSTSGLCKKLKISAPNMMNVLAELIDKKIVEKKGLGASIGGRKPELFGVVSDNFYIMGIEVSIYKVRMVIFDTDNKMLSAVEEFSIDLNQKDESLELIIDAANSFIKKSEIEKRKILGIGVSLPGLIDSSIGINHTYLCFDDKPVADLIEKGIGRPVFVENDAKAMALAEYRLGSAKGKKDVLVLYLDWGLGLGMILDGKLYRGTSGFAGEFSHIPMVENGKLCRCGKLGCLETITSGINILSMAEEGVKQGKTSIDLKGDNAKYKYLGFRSVVKSALEGDQYAIRILEENGRNLGKGISILIQLFNPEMIVLCGKLAESGELITTPIRQSINVHAMSQISEKASIVITEFGTEIGLYGALAVVMENVFNRYIPHSGK